MKCNHGWETLELTPKGPHYGKFVCCDCGAYLRWAKHPDTLIWEKAFKGSADFLLTQKLNDWERQFVSDIIKQFPKLSPKQKSKFEEVYGRYADRPQNS